MDSASGLQAYLASFLLPNIERIFALLLRDENMMALQNLFFQDKDELVIADFGSGPLSATVGFLSAIEYLFQVQQRLAMPKKIKIFAIERSEKIFLAGKELLEKAILQKDFFQIERITSVEKLPSNIDIALAANVFNEIPVKHRLFNMNNLFAKLNLNGLFLIVEPGQEVHSNALGQLRDQFLENAEFCEIISPCSHKNACPLSSSSHRTDWCWFRHGWQPPEALKEVEKFSKIDHHFLNFSYLFLAKSQTKAFEPYYARVVSDKLTVHLEKKNVLDYFRNNIEEGDEAEFLSWADGILAQKVLICANDGLLKSTLFEELDVEEFKRGRKLSGKNNLKFIFKERN